jgi:hypothetical protein
MRPRRNIVITPVRVWHLICLATVALIVPGAAVASAASSPGSDNGLPITTTVLRVPPETGPSEPHVAMDPRHPDRMYAVAQVQIPQLLTQELLWRTDDGGRTWVRSPLLGGSDNTSSTSGFSVDPVVAAGRNGLILFGAFTLDADEAAQTAILQVGTRVSTNHGATFTAFGGADRVTLPLCVFTTGCPPPPDAQGLDKPWLAIDNTDSRFRGFAYLVWVHDYADGRHQLRFAVSPDHGRSYERPIVLDRSTAGELAGLEELAQVAVRPDGTVHVVWNAVRHGRAVILHATSTDGGASFSAPERVALLRRDASRSGIVTTLAVSQGGRLGVCWSQARSRDEYDPMVECRATDHAGSWGAVYRALPGSHAREYLPAAAFQGERLWVAAYVSDRTSTRLVAVRARRHGFARPITVNRWRVPAARICGPRVPECLERQTFIGDYIGIVATPRRIAVAYIAPSPRAAQPNRVVMSTLRLTDDRTDRSTVHKLRDGPAGQPSR